MGAHDLIQGSEASDYKKDAKPVDVVPAAENVTAN